MTNTPDTSPEAVGRMAARLCTSQQPSIGQRRSIAATLCALSAERDALRAELVSTLSAAILDAQIRVLENRQLDTPDQIRANAYAFLSRHQKRAGV